MRQMPFFPFCFCFVLLLYASWGMQDLSSQTRNGTCALCNGSTESWPPDWEGSWCLPSLINSSGVIGNFLATWADLFPSRCSCWYYGTVQSLSHVLLFATPWTAATPGFPIQHQLPELAQTQCPLSQWCHPTISSSVVPFSRLQSFPASGSFPLNRFFTSGGQRIGVWASASVLPMNTQDWFPLGWTGWAERWGAPRPLLGSLYL